MNKIKKIIWNLPEIISCSTFSVMIVVVFANVVLRFSVQKSLLWTEEVAAICFIWSIFLGAAACYKERGGLISVDMLIVSLPSAISKVLTLLIDAFQVVMSLILCVLASQFAINAASKSSLSLRLPYTVYDMPIAIAFAFMAFFGGKRVLEDWRSLRGTNSSTDEEG